MGQVARGWAAASGVRAHAHPLIPHADPGRPEAARCLFCGAKLDEPDEARCLACRDKIWADELDRRRVAARRRGPTGSRRCGGAVTHMAA